MSSSPCPPAGFPAKYYTVTAGGECVRQGSFFQGKAVLNQGVGYSVILGFGAFFAFFTSFLVWLEKRYVGARHTSEWFNTAGRNVKTGLIASVIVSQWTWAATILQSSNVAWQYGVSGPFWYASGATAQVLLFGVMAIEIKRKAPQAHTVCEIVKARWGTAAHVVFLAFCFMTNVVVTAMLLLGGSAVFNALTGVNIYAASFLIPLGVIVYTLAGGLMATFLASYIHSVIVHVVLVIFVYLMYTASGELGSPRVVYDRLLEVASKSRACNDPVSHFGQACGPVNGNYKGSYLTMLSSGGLVFGIINIVGNFGTVFVDNGYWVSAIVARPSSTHKGYLLGGLVWFAVPFSLATSLGLGALALDLPITASEASRGLVPPATAIALMGKSDSVLLLTMLFMAVTSAGSSELIAVSSLCTYDIYRTYINPEANPQGVESRRARLRMLHGRAGRDPQQGRSLPRLDVPRHGCAHRLRSHPHRLHALMEEGQRGRGRGRNNRRLHSRYRYMALGDETRVRPREFGHHRTQRAHARREPRLHTDRRARAHRLQPRFAAGLRLADHQADHYRREGARRAAGRGVQGGEADEGQGVDSEVGRGVHGRHRRPVAAALASGGGFQRGLLHVLGSDRDRVGDGGVGGDRRVPLKESWGTIGRVCSGVFANDRVVERIEEVNLRLRAIMVALPEAEQVYVLEKEKAKVAGGKEC